jgi:hypothetical protein
MPCDHLAGSGQQVCGCEACPFLGSIEVLTHRTTLPV